MTYSDRLTAEFVESHRWQMRAKAAGLTQRVLSRLLGHAENTISRQLRGHWSSGIPRHVVAAIMAWEIMSEEQRRAWVHAVDREHPRTDLPSARPHKKARPKPG